MNNTTKFYFSYYLAVLFLIHYKITHKEAKKW